MNEFEEAFEEALVAAAEAKGESEKVTFQGQELEAIVGENDVDIIPGAGGEVDSATLQIGLRKSEVQLPIANLAPIEVRGRSLKVIHYYPLEGRVNLLVGSPEEQMN